MKYLLFIVLQLCTFCAAAQNDSIVKVPIDRQYFHDLVTKEQKRSKLPETTKCICFSPMFFFAGLMP